MKIYDTKSRKKVEFKPIEEDHVKMYVCGPTVYNKVHIGNARTFISFDMIRRYLIYRGYEVTFVQNLTDVDDKIIKKANEEGVSASEISEKFSEKFISDMRCAGVLDPDIRPKATEEIPEMIELIEILIEKGYAYVVEGDVYFKVIADKNYGCLSGRDIFESESGHRELVADNLNIEDRKEDRFDFALWKTAKPGEPSWDSPWGKGRPGWHTECACMSKKYLGLPFDIHGGGSDLMFPHHENEIAQAECAWNQGFANIWMHAGMLRVNNEKMSKSLGNFLMLDDILKTTEPKYLRMLTLQTHYRSPLNFSDERLLEATKALQNIENTISNINWLIENAVNRNAVMDASSIKQAIQTCRTSFIEFMDDDFNAPAAIGEIAKLSNFLNTEYANKTISKADIEISIYAIEMIQELLSSLGIDLEDTNTSENNETIEPKILSLLEELTGDNQTKDALECIDKLLEIRATARQDKDWALSDKIRDTFQSCGYLIEDTPQGAKVRRS